MRECAVFRVPKTGMKQRALISFAENIASDKILIGDERFLSQSDVLKNAMASYGNRDTLFVARRSELPRSDERDRGEEASLSAVLTGITLSDDGDSFSLFRDFVDTLPQDCEIDFNTLGQRLVRFFEQRGHDFAVKDVHPWPLKTFMTPEQLRWRWSVRGEDGLVSTLIIRPVSLHVSKLASRASVTPNSLTAASLILAIGAAVLIAGTTGLLGTVLPLFLMYLSLVADCSDGEVARYNNTASKFGAWFDAFTDRVKEHIIIAALVIAHTPVDGKIWAVASASIILLLLRHLSSFAFINVLGAARNPKDFNVLMSSDLWARRPGLGSTSPARWLRRILHAPVSERWFVLAIFLAIGRPDLSVIGYAIFVAVSLALTLVGWQIRSRGFHPSWAQSKRVYWLKDSCCSDPSKGARASWLGVPLFAALEFVPCLIFLIVCNGISAVMVFCAVVMTTWLRYERAQSIVEGRSINHRWWGWETRIGFWLIIALLAAVGIPHSVFAGAAVQACVSGGLLLLGIGRRHSGYHAEVDRLIP